MHTYLSKKSNTKKEEIITYVAPVKRPPPSKSLIIDPKILMKKAFILLDLTLAISNKIIPENCEGLLGRFFSTLKEESDGPPGLYDINDMAKEAGIGQTPRRVKIVKALQDLGYFASSSVFSPLGIKTTAPEKKRNEALEHAQSL